MEGGMPDGLYERDALAWSEQQAGLLRCLAHGERVNDAVDWPNLIEEVEAVGRSELRACESLLRQAAVHLLKLHADPGSDASAHWRRELMIFLVDARKAFSPSMRQKIDLQDVYNDALYLIGDTGSAPAKCPLVLDDLLAPRPDIDVLLGQFGR